MKDCCSDGNNGEYDIAVVGAGSAGFSAAITAAEAGARVAIIGHGTIGGTCVNVGCVPSKAIIRAMEAAHSGAAARRFAGVSVESRVDDWSAVQAQKDALGFSSYSLSEAQSIGNNDWLLIALSEATELDLSNYFSMWGMATSDKAKQQVQELKKRLEKRKYSKK